MSVERSPSWEDFEAARWGGPSFAAEVTAALAKGQELYGDAWKVRTVDELLAEAEEEAVDFAAWLLLARQRGEPLSIVKCRAGLGRAAHAWQEIRAMREELAGRLSPP